jgi:hydroxymethylpyrimidine/phosphomethylpyrimidine kinase
MNYIISLTIAGSDCSGGAGIQADIKTFSALGCYAASAITAVTVQDTRGVEAVHAVPPHMVAAQVKAVMGDLRPQAAKVGMAVDGPMVRAIADALDGAHFHLWSTP